MRALSLLVHFMHKDCFLRALEKTRLHSVLSGHVQVCMLVCVIEILPCVHACMYDSHSAQCCSSEGVQSLGFQNLMWQRSHSTDGVVLTLISKSILCNHPFDFVFGNR